MLRKEYRGRGRFELVGLELFRMSRHAVDPGTGAHPKRTGPVLIKGRNIVKAESARQGGIGLEGQHLVGFPVNAL